MSAGCLFPLSFPAKTIKQTSQTKHLFRATIAGLHVTDTKRRVSLTEINGGVIPTANIKTSPISSLSAYRSTKMEEEQVYQYVVVMRHGDRLDNVDPLWISMSGRPWDPPLHQDGMVRAFTIGRMLRKSLGAPIHRAFVSPFLRCLQTASEVVRALCTVDEDAIAAVDFSKIKVSIEKGLCEMLNTTAIKPNVAPKDGVFKFDMSECEAKLPVGTIDHSAEQVYKKLPEWGETGAAARARYIDIVKELADKYPSENLLLVTHGEGVASAFSAFMNGVTVYNIEYCGFTILRRSIHFGENQSSFTAGELTHQSDFGIKFLAATDDPTLK